MRFNTPIAELENADVILLVGSNVRWEAPLVNTRLRKAVRRGAKVFAIGPEVDLTYKVEWLGDDLSLLGKLPKAAADAIKGAEQAGDDRRPGRARGRGAGRRAGRLRTRSSRTGWNGFNVLHIAAARMAGLLLGYAQKGGIADIEKAKPELVILLGADEVPAANFSRAFKVYIGHHGDKGAAQADLVLPGATYAEKHGTYVNIEGRVQRSERAAFAPGDAREDWTIFRALVRPDRQAAAVRPLRPASRGDDRRGAGAGPGRDHRHAVGAAEARRQGVRPGRLIRSRIST